MPRDRRDKRLEQDISDLKALAKWNQRLATVIDGRKVMIGPLLNRLLAALQQKTAHG